MPEMKLGKRGFIRGSETWIGFFTGKLTAKQAVIQAYVNKISSEAKVEMTQIREEIRTEYDGYVKGWRHKPTFISTVTTSPTAQGAKTEIKVRTAQDEAGIIFGYVDKGTPMHRIPKSGYKAMPMRVYNPKTQGGTGRRIPTGGGYGPQRPNIRTVVFKQSITARDFTNKSRIFWKKEFPRRIRNAARKAFRRKTR